MTVRKFTPPREVTRLLPLCGPDDLEPITMPERLWEWVDTGARESGRTWEEICRFVIRKYLADPDELIKSQQWRAKRNVVPIASRKSPGGG